MDRVENLRNKINKLNDTLENAPGIPSHIANELKELYKTKAFTVCPCLTRASQRWDPIKPVAPVISSFSI